MRIRSNDFFLGLGAIVLSLAYLYVAGQIAESFLSDEVGAAGVPKVLGWALGGLGVLLCLRSVALGNSSDAQAAGAAAPAEPDAESKGMRPHFLALGMLGILIAYIVVAPYIGYALSMVVLVAVLARYCGAPFNRNLILISIVAGCGLWFAFVFLLSIPMPVGLFWEGV